MQTTATPSLSAQPLTALSEEERMFQAAAREFAEKEIRPHVEEMDREGVFNHDLIDKFFAQGFMGIEVPEPTAEAAARSSWRCWPSRNSRAWTPRPAVVIDVQNTLVTNALMRWGNEHRRKHSCLAWRTTPWAPTLCPSPTPAATLLAWRRGPKKTATILF